MFRTPESASACRKPTTRTRSRSSYERPNHNTLHAQLPSRTSPRRPAEDVSKLTKFLRVLSALRQRQQFVLLIDVQVIFVLGLESRQNESASVRLGGVPR